MVSFGHFLGSQRLGDLNERPLMKTKNPSLGIYIVKLSLGIYFVFLFAVFLIGPHQRRLAMNQSLSLADRLVGIDGPFAVMGVIFLFAGYMSIRERYCGLGMRSYWPLIASIVSTVIFIGLSLFYISFSKGVGFWQGKLMFVLPQLLSLIGLFVFWPRREHVGAEEFDDGPGIGGGLEGEMGGGS